MIKFPLHKQIYGSLLVVIVLCAPLAFSAYYIVKEFMYG